MTHISEEVVPKTKGTVVLGFFFKFKNLIANLCRLHSSILIDVFNLIRLKARNNAVAKMV